MERQLIFQEVKKVGDPDGPQGNKTPVDLVPKGSNVNGLIGCTGLWFAGGKCGVTWKLIQACVRPPVRLVGTGTCHVEVDSDDEDLLTTLNKDQDDIAAEVKEALPQPTFVDTDGEEEEEEEECVEEVEVVPSPKKKKKKIVRKKKKASE